jgi:hypothetical protein
MKGRKIFFTLAANKPDRSKDLGVIFSWSKTAIQILNVMGCNDYVLSNFKKIFIVSTRGTGKRVDGMTIFFGHDVNGSAGGWQEPVKERRRMFRSGKQKTPRG